jgi:hypothetical protein
MENQINIEDIVSIHWENIEPELNVVVLYIPCATGDSWRFRREDGTIIYVNTFAKIIKHIQG